ncbi:hypothetical protein COCC4DRAFT_19072 [Bipolaris maydis ATCC 48331]|uniref:Cytochrome P450 monooxygenase oblB n=2 Tax=Cochliobolus heterostrophus TaxID=5016 RepID=OBLB_COCH5|nr:uncharacterized protein COCC4DRAFT_19072 [Bipolaris maydis ATCC 48331]M2V933.1 RecName: Full=Cytochrome P450 monooxygenase oblB; AltName: Full=Ophiobolin biosynthesis cluster protein B [Bipolaris maydis C5]KAH7562072.1 hypothetical protein BM1_03176 [Bipolaris maydis]EMD96233.1 hypothetical protein COCHEDRAFT_1201083 [Bipolaris maydis C5]ENI11092.1 hypothetical protein COCC4DRAFT_19072 [Bipolaris maydis ATCC 48331]KAJ5030897.1 cytochrome P450 [Bipolaris maydis]KAJ5065924.1 putative cytochr
MSSIQLQKYLDLLPENAILNAGIAIAGLSAAYAIGLVIYRLYLSPISKFPGPKIAAATFWYELYYDVIHKGQYFHKIEEMHEKYGPIVRINPHELSIRDPDYYDELYVSGSVRPSDRYEGFVNGVVDFEGSHLATVAHELHRKRRKPLDPYFSRAGVNRLEPMVADLTEELVVKRFEEFKGTGKVVRLDHAFTAYSGDIISALCIDEPPHFTSTPDFTPSWFDLFHSGVVTLPLFMGLPWLIHLIRLIPESILAVIDPGAQNWNTFRMMCYDSIKDTKREKGAQPTKDTSLLGRPTLFRHLVNSDLPASELSDERLLREAQVLIGSGTMTTAGTMCFLVYYIKSNPEIHRRLTEELKPIMEGYPHKKPSWAEIEKAEYLQAVLKEGLRLSFGTIHRRPRVSPNQPLQFKEWVIPAGVPVGMSAYFQHTDPKIFPNPHEFNPDRWLSNVTPAMKKNYVPFSKGSRHCLGMNLAYCELNYIIATMFRPGAVDFDLFETTELDVKPTHDMVVPLPSLKSKGFKVKFN